MLRKVALFVLTRVADLRSTCCNITRIELLIKFLRGILKILVIFWEDICHGVLFQSVAIL